MTQMVMSVERRSWVQSITGEPIAKDVTRRKMNEKLKTRIYVNLK